MNIAVFASGSGTNFQAIIDRVKDGYIPARIVLLVSDNKDAYAVERAKRSGIEAFVLSPKGFKAREDYDRELIKKLKEKKVELVVLSGFMRLMSGYFLKEYVEQNIIPVDPFQTIDQTGVGELIKITVERGRKARKDIKIGICGEQGGDPASVDFCHNSGLNYVSCSPFRVPIAILAAAQSQIIRPRKNK